MQVEKLGSRPVNQASRIQAIMLRLKLKSCPLLQCPHLRQQPRSQPALTSPLWYIPTAKTLPEGFLSCNSDGSASKIRFLADDLKVWIVQEGPHRPAEIGGEVAQASAGSIDEEQADGNAEVSAIEPSEKDNPGASHGF